MSLFPETRYSLIARLERSDDGDAWREFLAIYRPIVYRIGRRRGLQHADAEDLSQQVFARVRGAIANWEPDPARGRFRSWLARIAQNATINALTRRRPDAAIGGTSVLTLLDDQLGREETRGDAIQLEFRRSLFRWAAARIRGEFRTATWNAFWQSMVEGEEVPVVAATLGVSVGSVYAARSRIMRRLKTEIELHEKEFHDNEPDHVDPSVVW